MTNWMRSQGRIFFTMRITGFDVVPGGLRVTMQGHNVDFAELQAYQQ